MRTLFTLRRLLALDAAGCAVMGIALTVAAGPLASLTAISAGFLFGTGSILLAVAAFVALVALKPVPPRAAVAVIVAGNIGWVVASLAVISLDVIAPNTIGAGLLVLQAAAVGVLALLEWSAMARRSGTMAEPVQP